MTSEIRFQLAWPTSTNAYWRPVLLGRFARLILTKKAREYRKAVQYVIQGLNWAGPIVGHLRFEPPTRRRYDLSNFLKPLEDALMHAGVFVDDSQLIRWELEKGDLYKPGGRVLVTLQEVDVAEDCPPGTLPSA